MNRDEEFWFGASSEIELLEAHDGQTQILDLIPDYTFFVVPCARRFGKSTMIWEIEGALIESSFTDEVAIFTPNSKDADPLWYGIEEKYSSKFARKDGTKRRLKFVDDGELEFWSLPNQRAKENGRGRKYYRVIFDETQKIDEAVIEHHFDKVILALLLDYPDAKVFFFGTPNGKNTMFHKFARRGARNGNKLGLLGSDSTDIPEMKPNEDGSNPYSEWITIRRPTSANPHISAEVLEKILSEYDELTADQEIRARFVDYAGNIWCHKLKSKEIQKKTFVKGLTVDRNKPIYLGFDFNKQPMTCTLAQMPPIFGYERFKHGVEFIKEFITDIEEKASIYDTIRLIQDYFFEEFGVKIGKWYDGKRDNDGWKLIGNYPCPFHIRVTGDASGDVADGRQRISKTYYDIIADELNLSYAKNFDILKQNPYHADSFVQINYYLERHPNFRVDEDGCPNLKRDMLSVKSDKLRGIDKSQKDLTHSLDNLRYIANTYKPTIEIPIY